MKEYTIYHYKGITKGNKSYCSFTTGVESLSYYSHTVKDFFEHKNTIFRSCSITLKEARKMVEEGKIFIPISSTIDSDEILKYCNIGLIPVFMKAKEYNQFKKDYALEA